MNPFQILYYVSPIAGAVTFIHSDVIDCPEVKAFKSDYESLYSGESLPSLYVFNHTPELPDAKTEDEYDFDAEEAIKVIAKHLWNEFGNVPVDENGTDGAIEEPFVHFCAGTMVYTIWGWFEDEFNIPVHSLMFPESQSSYTH
ncbi:hypothetical protein OCF84_21690 (plasmid) [Shewanella xiamenensis]|uniref:Phage protein n=1 Tax=Shewanella xiamenensis TaxID=332186 RepID=A0ABT6UDG5_9GAMM|nr:hypothetical protein [Shewanella xiamenensis]MDI5832508.1 hypothetical protein [Shewanella xiamenensis]WHF57873.1 hypothetical protein OCF84_21690 [Shewanella xiamenensis]